VSKVLWMTCFHKLQQFYVIAERLKLLAALNLPLNIVGNFSKSAGKWYFIIRTASSENLSPRGGHTELLLK